MKQSEKLDLILKALYESPHKRGEIHELLGTYNIEVSGTDARIMGEKLHKEGLIEFIGTIGGKNGQGGFAILTGDGVAYVEEDSYSQKGQAIIYNNYNISHSPNTSFVSNSSQVTVNQNIGDIDHKISEIAEKIRLENTITDQEKEEFLDCLKEVAQGIADKRKPKWAFNSLMSLSANVASVAQLVIQLGQLSGLS